MGMSTGMFRLWKKPAPAITPDELARALAGGDAPLLIDIRNPKEYAAGHLPGAVNLPLAERDPCIQTLDRAARIVFY